MGVSMFVLLVDDEPEFAEELAEGLEAHGLVPVVVPRAEDALLELEGVSGTIVVITDLRMPGMDGFALIEAATRQEKKRDVHFIVMTGHATEPDMARARALGAEECIRKPFSLDDVLTSIDRIRK